MLLVILFLPLAAAVVCLVRPPRPVMEAATLASAAGIMVIAALLAAGVLAGRNLSYGFLSADALTVWFLPLVGAVSFLGSLHSVGYLRGHDRLESDRPRRCQLYYVLWNLFIGTMVLLLLSRNLGILWIAMEATTLASAFLVWYHDRPETLEAAWKYVLITSVGSLLALLGTFLVVFAAGVPTLDWVVLRGMAPRMPAGVLEVGFLLALVGYGTKAGYAPMHTWLPDAHGQAPSPVSALLSGAEINCAVYAIMRFRAVALAGLGPVFPSRLLLAFGLFSLALAAFFLLVQKDYKRMLAYSSVEHMGIIAVGLSLGGPLALLGTLWQVFNHAAAKATVFLSSGNVLLRYRTSNIGEVTGILSTMPFSGSVFLLGGLALTGLPPFGPFLSEFTIFTAAFSEHLFAVGALLVLLITLALAGLLKWLNRMVFGPPSVGVSRGEINWWTTVPLGLGLVLVLVPGLFWPSWAQHLASLATGVMGVN